MIRRRAFVIGCCWFCCCVLMRLVAASDTKKTMAYCSGGGGGGAAGDTNCLQFADSKNFVDFNRLKLCPSDRKLFEARFVSTKQSTDWSSDLCPVLIDILKSNRNQSSDCLFPSAWSSTPSMPPTTVAKTASAVATASDLLTTLPLNNGATDGHDLDHSDDDESSLKIWTYSLMAVTLINLCGLFGLAVIPITNKPYYEHLLQFFVALAVGTLCGDALLHLLPHAIESHSGHSSNDDHHDHHDHQHSHHHGHNTDTIWKGFVVMVSIVAFFFIEKFAMFCSEWRNRKQRCANKISRVKVMHEGDNVNIVGEKLCKHKYSSFPYCYDDIAVKRIENSCMEKCHNETEICTLGPMGDKIKPEMDTHTRNLLRNDFGSCSIAAVTAPTTDTNSNGNSVMKPLKNGDFHDDPSNAGTIPTVDDQLNNCGSSGAGPLNRETYTVIIREHENKHHGHSHTHVHVHSAPQNLSSVAWMVIMGDGLHNFTDGVAIGAAFTASIAGGFSTTLAVFCHELPHELGDFAVLLKAGMSAKEALCYSLLSSILCYVGMLCGIALENFDRGSSWTFAVTAGSFLYIALVDLIPELSSSHLSETGSVIKSLLQLAGISCGLLIMTLIAIYEDTLITVFN